METMAYISEPNLPNEQKNNKFIFHINFFNFNGKNEFIDLFAHLAKLKRF